MILLLVDRLGFEFPPNSDTGYARQVDISVLIYTLGHFGCNDAMSFSDHQRSSVGDMPCGAGTRSVSNFMVEAGIELFFKYMQRRIQDFWKGGSNNYIHKRGWVLEGACPLP